MSKTLLFLTIAIFSVLTYSCSSEDELKTVNTEEDNATLVEFSFDLTNVKDQLVQLDSLESMEIPVNPVISGGKRPMSRSSVVTPVIGTITNLGNQKTVWKYGVGENLVPQYLCGSSFNEMTISTVYKISIRYDLTDDYMVKGYTGENSGWQGVYLYNPQTKYQGTIGDDTYVEFYTYVFDIISSLQGYTPPGGHLWVPCNESEARLYVRIYE